MPRKRPNAGPRTLRSAVAVFAVSLLIFTACGEEIVVRQKTTVFWDGTLNRTIEVSGRGSDGEIPTDPDWLRDEVHLELADREIWGTIEEQPGRILAEGFFNSADDIPATLTHETESGLASDRTTVRVEQEDLVLVRRWTYVETHGDPFGHRNLEMTLDRLTDLLVESLAEELRLELGPGVDTRKAEDFLRDEGRRFGLELLTALRSNLWTDPGNERIRRVLRILGNYGVRAPDLDTGVSTAGYEDSFELLEDLLDPILLWARERVAATLATPEESFDPDDLGFWPTGETLEELWNEEEPPPPGHAEEFVRLTESLGQAMTGYYGDLGAPRFRFEIRLEMPGRLLRTNGTIDDDEVLWLIRGGDLVSGDASLSAESVELIDETLVSLGARRDLDPSELLRLVDLLTTRDPSGQLREIIGEAVRRGRLDVVNELAEDELDSIGRELVDLLDPEREPWPPEI
jgi:hypothetical protein